MATTTFALTKGLYMDSSAPTTNYGANVSPRYIGGISGTNRSILHFVMPSLNGTITKITYNSIVAERGGADFTAELHQMTRDTWTQLGATWNKYDGTNNWTAAGGDYSATIIHSLTTPTVGNWASFHIYGGSSTNPVTLNWGDNFYGELKGNVETAGRYCGFNGGTGIAYHYVEVTYTQVKSINGLLKASVKSKEGLAAASIKSMNGLAF